MPSGLRIGLVVGATLLAASARAASPVPDSDTPSRWAFLESELHARSRLRVVINRAPGAGSVAVCHVSLAPRSLGFGTEVDRRPTARWIAQRGGEASLTARGRQLEQCVSIGAGELELALWHIFGAQADVGPVDSGRIDPKAQGRVARLALGEHTGPGPEPVLVVVGSAATGQILRHVDRWYAPGGMPDDAPQPLPSSALGPAAGAVAQSRERLSVLTADDLTTPAVYCGWRQEPTLATAQRLAVMILATGETSRFGFNLVHRRGLANRTEAWQTTLDGGSVIGISVGIAPGAGVDKMLRFFDGALAQLRLVGPTAAEVDRARALFETQALLTLSAPLGRARALAQAEFLTGNAHTLRERLEAAAQVTPETIRVAAQSLRPVLRSLVEAYPPGWPLDDPAMTGYVLYTARQGDTWPAIARRFEIPLSRLTRDNDADARYRPVLGQPVWIAPRPNGTPRVETNR